MTIAIHTRLTRKYMHEAIIMSDYYTEARLYNGTDSAMYLVNGEGTDAILCDSIVSIDFL